ncbi:MAG: Hpt domain-containing protein [Nitrospinota bacterium]|nr:Hpt domain-containing protein [Nitrospinota bacterium]
MKNQESFSDKIRVRVDPDLQDLIPGYLENRARDLLKYQENLEKNDFDAIAILGHSMKGSGGGYGFNGLSNIGRAIEKAAKNNDKDSVQQSINDLTDYLNKLEILYD